MKSGVGGTGDLPRRLPRPRRGRRRKKGVWRSTMDFVHGYCCLGPSGHPNQNETATGKGRDWHVKFLGGGFGVRGEESG